VAAAALGWWLTRPGTPSIALEDRIPLAGPEMAAGARAEAASETTALDQGGAADGGSVPVASSAAGGAAQSAGPAEELVVHVVGEVARPGLVTLDPGARISDAVDAAGGPREGADIERLNLAAPAIDGMQIRVPAVGEGDEEGLPGPTTPLVRLPRGGGSGETPGEDGAGPVVLNRAGPQELESLPGVGPAIAAAIVAWRDDNGGFATVDDLLDVPGIGPAKLAALRDRVTV
jgi:competence protein ComEA